MGIIIPDFQQPVWAEQWLVCKVVAHLCANLLEITTQVFWFFKITLHNSAVLVMFEWNVFVNRVCVCVCLGWDFNLRVDVFFWATCFYQCVIDLLRNVLVMVMVRMRIRGNELRQRGSPQVLSARADVKISDEVLPQFSLTSAANIVF